MTAKPITMLLLVCGLLCLAKIAAAQEHDEQPTDRSAQQVDVYLLTGQSNMVGSGRVNQLPEPWRGPVAGVSIYQGGGFVPLVAGAGSPNGRFGPEVGFARLLREHDNEPPLYLIKFALGGQPLDAGWDGGRWQGEAPGPGRKTFYPGASPDDPNIGLHYRRLMDQAQQAFATLRKQGLEPVLRGVLWMQGEADSKHEVSADRYAETLALFKKRIEQDLGSGPVPFVFGQVLPHEPALDRFVARDLIRQRMAEADERSGSERAIQGVRMVPTDGMPLHDDTVHYNTRGQMLLGQAFGLAMLQAQHAAE